MKSMDYEEKIRDALASVGISETLIAAKRLPFHREAQQLIVAEIDMDGRPHLLVPRAAIAWHTLKAAASNDSITLEIVSAFRGIEEQLDIIRTKLNSGVSLLDVLKLSAPPGYSEHHTGCAVDINTPGCIAREEPFENTDAFRWLTNHAGKFGFTLSYPRANALGFIYEPWHWFFRTLDES